jgi:hypothetical protein
MNRSPRRRIVAAALLFLAFAAVASQAVHAQDRPRRERGDDPQRELSSQQLRIRRGQSMARRVARDTRISPEMRQKATELTAAIDRRDQLLTALEERHRQFLAQHKAEIDELEDMRLRARELERRLGEARNDVLRASESEIVTLRQESARAAELADALRTGYLQERRDRRRR